MRYPFLAALMLLVLSSVSVSALSTIVVVPTNNKITNAEEAVFQVIITNNEAILQTYTLYGLEVAWSIDPEDRRFSLNQRQSKTTMVKVRPFGPFQPSSYSLKLYIDVAPGPDVVPTDRYVQDLPVILYPANPAEYLPALWVNVGVNEKILTPEPVSITLDLENRNPLNLTGLMIRIQSDMPEFRKEALVDILPLDKKTVEFKIQPNVFQPPRQYTLFFVFEREGQLVKVVEKQVEVMPFNPAFAVQREDKHSFLKQQVRLTVTNGGNVADTQDVKVPVSFLGSLFALGESQARTEQGQHYLVWSIPLSSNESTSISYTINYRIILYVIIGSLVLLIFYIIVHSPLRIRKTAEMTRGEEGTLSELKITLQVENLSRKPLQNILISDLVPGIANVQKSLELGTIKPLEIKPTRHGAKVVWTLAELDVQEHRIITYNIKAKLNILGRLSLPRATVEYTKGKNRHGKVYSNIFQIGP